MTLPINYREFLSERLNELSRYSKWDVISIVREFVDAVEAKLLKIATEKPIEESRELGDLKSSRLISKLGCGVWCVRYKPGHSVARVLVEKLMRHFGMNPDEFRQRDDAIVAIASDVEDFLNDAVSQSKMAVSFRRIVLGEPVKECRPAPGYYFTRKKGTTETWSLTLCFLDGYASDSWEFFGPFEIVELPKPIEPVVREGWTVGFSRRGDFSNPVYHARAKGPNDLRWQPPNFATKQEAVQAWNDLKIG